MVESPEYALQDDSPLAPQARDAAFPAFARQLVVHVSGSTLELPRAPRLRRAWKERVPHTPIPQELWFCEHGRTGLGASLRRRDAQIAPGGLANPADHFDCCVSREGRACARRRLAPRKDG